MLKLTNWKTYWCGHTWQDTLSIRVTKFLKNMYGSNFNGYLLKFWTFC